MDKEKTEGSTMDPLDVLKDEKLLNDNADSQVGSDKDSDIVLMNPPSDNEAIEA